MTDVKHFKRIDSEPGARHVEIKPFEIEELSKKTQYVIPEIFNPRLRRAGTNPVSLKPFKIKSLWIPAFAGMTLLGATLTWP